MILSSPADSAPSYASPSFFATHLSWVEMKNKNPNFQEGTFKTSLIPGTLTSVRLTLPAWKKTGDGGGPEDFRWLAVRTKKKILQNLAFVNFTGGPLDEVVRHACWGVEK
ncbi:hypothetical protein TB2_026311 [Malus domestica]